MSTNFKIKYNTQTITSLNAFSTTKFNWELNNLNDTEIVSKDVLFIRGLGEPNNLEAIIANIDNSMNQEMNNETIQYVRLSKLPNIPNLNVSNFYVSIYEKLTNNQSYSFQNIEMVSPFDKLLENALSWTLSQYAKCKTSITETISKNVAIKLLFWLDSIIFYNLNQYLKNNVPFKILAHNVSKEHEYLFYLFLTQLGCDVFLLQNIKDIEIPEGLKKLSQTITLGNFGSTQLSTYKINIPLINSNNIINEINNNMNGISIPSYQNRELTTNNSNSHTQSTTRRPLTVRTANSNTNNNNASNTRTTTSSTTHTSSNNSSPTEKSYEELAKLASSIVMINIYDKDKKLLGGGSGIMINHNGHILTNAHVVANGDIFGVRIEEDTNEYFTTEIVKKNDTADLAIIRINKKTNPLPIYQGNKELVRGQKVVAIGSPLGFFNSVSDGIISGFRMINGSSMIQFTAPISHGSSGGALLNMNGEIIGISTAGFDAGQNINLAVSYERITLFAQTLLL